MKELIIVDKTHLDLGFTDTAENVRRRYLTSFIPAAIDTAEKVNDGAEKKFVWTTGAWLIKEAFESGGELSRRTEKALKDGNIAAHAFPFTTHTELMDCDLLEYGLSIIDRIDKVSGRKTIAAKMTDVPGHTAAVVPMLAKHGIKLLHIGTNTAAARPDVPNLFLWKFGGAEVVVIYSDGYGGMFSSPLTDKILYLDNAADNYGVRKPSAILRRFRRFQKQYPDYTIRAGRLDDIAENLWAVRDKLPVITDEIGDTWIHGAASDPYKTAALRTLNRLKQKWLAQGDIVRDSDAYRKFSDALLCITEHTWGGDMKVTLEDTEHYRKDKFVKAHKRDIVKFHNIFGDFPFRFLAFFGKAACKKEYSYSKIERTWTEQREYLEKAMSALPCTCKKEAERCLSALRPDTPDFPECTDVYETGTPLRMGKFTLSVNAKGGADLTCGNECVLDAGSRPLVRYTSYGKEDFDYYAKHYLRHTAGWAVSDNLRPGLKPADCPCATYDYDITSAFFKTDEQETKILLNMKCDPTACECLGAPRHVTALYRLTETGLSLDVCWTGKDAVRTAESTVCLFYPAAEEISYCKLGQKVDPKRVVSRGNRKISAIEYAAFAAAGSTFRLENAHAALAATDGGNILHFDDSPADIKSNGLSFILHNNVWGTNFPLWYGENAAFSFALKETKE